MLHIDVGEVEVYPFHEHIRGDESLFISVVHHCAVISYAFLCAFILEFYVLSEVSDKAKLTQFLYFHYVIMNLF